jgi:hypothetical protein
MENIGRGPIFGDFCHYPHRGVDAGRHGCKTTGWIQEYRLPSPPLLNVMYCVKVSLRTVKIIEIDTLEYQQTEKIETELKDVDRIRAYRCTQLCPGCPSGASRSHNTIYYYPTADSPPLKNTSQMESSVQDNPAAPSPCQMREF